MNHRIEVSDDFFQAMFELPIVKSASVSQAKFEGVMGIKPNNALQLGEMIITNDTGSRYKIKMTTNPDKTVLEKMI